MKSGFTGRIFGLGIVCAVVLGVSTSLQASDQGGLEKASLSSVWLDWTKKNGQEQKRDRRRVIKDPLIIWIDPPKSTDKPKKDPPAKPSN